MTNRTRHRSPRVCFAQSQPTFLNETRLSVLRSLQIKHFAIAEHIELDIRSGLNVITGETGAGKSIMIRALGMVLGQRADSGMVKHGQQRADILADFDISRHQVVKSLLIDLDIDDQGECLLRRVINADSGSKAYVNGHMVTAGTMRQIGEQLLDIHGQHEHQSLLRNEVQQSMLDQYAGLGDKVTQLQDQYADLHTSISALELLRAEADAAHEKLAFLSYQVDELEQFSPQEDEWESLYSRHQKIHHQAELGASVQAAEQLLFGSLSDSGGANAQLGRAIAELEKAQAIDPALKDISNLLNEAQTLMNESELSLRHASESLMLDEAELEQIEQRYSGYLNFARKHRVEPQQLFSSYVSLSSQLQAARNPERSEQSLLEKINVLALAYQQLAEQISTQRNTAAKTLSSEISASMQSLAMEGGSFIIKLEAVEPMPCPEGLNDSFPAIGRDFGNEKVRFEVSTNAGMPAQALSKVASGGELSRISLAIQLILSDLASVETLVFDEVDVGVGGKTAAVIGRMLAQLANSRQIICITHLPQVAAFGSSHFHVNKSHVTKSHVNKSHANSNEANKHQSRQVALNIDELDAKGRIDEIARMVGGESITEESLAHAQNLLGSSV